MRIFGIAISLLFAVESAVAFHPKFDHWPLETRIAGRILLTAELSDPSALSAALRTAASDAHVQLLFYGVPDKKLVDDYTAAFADHPFQSVQSTDVSDFCELVRTALRSADVCCLHFLKPLTPSEEQQIVELNAALQAFVRQPKSLIVIGPVIESLKLLPDTLIQLSTDSANVDSLCHRLLQNPRHVGLHLTSTAIVVLNQRRIRVVGTGTATFVIATPRGTVFQQQTIAEQTSPRQRPDAFLIDLTQWCRIAIDRTLPPFPGTERKQPFVDNGTLLIVGGGALPAGLMERLIELAGGAEEARLVYIPCSEEPRLGTKQRTVAMWKKMGVKHAAFLHTKDRRQANEDSEFLEPLKEATGIWFGGGRQWNFADSYYGTTAQQYMKDVLKRGGVIGGSSAGASVQAEYLARATPVENLQIMAPGYERGGLGFIAGVAIDQHFSQRQRQPDMTTLVNRYPNLLGIGIDEQTALIVQKSQARVLGQGHVYFYDRQRYADTADPDYVRLPAGSTYDLATRMFQAADEPAP